MLIPRKQINKKIVTFFQQFSLKGDVLKHCFCPKHFLKREKEHGTNFMTYSTNYLFSFKKFKIKDITMKIHVLLCTVVILLRYNLRHTK